MKRPILRGKTLSLKSDKVLDKKETLAFPSKNRGWLDVLGLTYFSVSDPFSKSNSQIENIGTIETYVNEEEEPITRLGVEYIR